LSGEPLTLPNDQRLFVYGTLRDSEVQVRVIGRQVPGEPAVLVGWRKDWIQVGGDAAAIARQDVHPIAVPDPEGEIEGLVLSLTEKEWPALDEYEGEPYERVAAEQKDGSTAWFYAARS
jgi:gamma-glutamylcyclotransferase (GGCT)/AIG2-like uncharacterized protein YtfP